MISADGGRVWTRLLPGWAGGKRGKGNGGGGGVVWREAKEGEGEEGKGEEKGLVVRTYVVVCVWTFWGRSLNYALTLALPPQSPYP